VSFFSVLTIILVIVGMIGSGILFLVIKYMRFPHVTGTKVIWEDTTDTGGSAISNLLSKRYVNGRVLLKCLPLDKEDPKPFDAAVETNKIDIRPRGLWMGEADAIRILPYSVDAWFANAFKQLETSNAQKNIIRAKTIGSDLQAAHLSNMGEGEVSRQDMALQEGFKSQQLKIATKEDKAGKPGGYPATQSSGRDSFVS